MLSSSISPAPARRRWPIEEKRRIVELTMRKGVTIQSVAEKFGIHATTLSVWRVLYREGQLALGKTANAEKAPHATLLPVTVAVPTCITSNQSNRSVVNINFASGTSVRVEVDVLHFTDLGALLIAIR